MIFIEKVKSENVQGVQDGVQDDIGSVHDYLDSVKKLDELIVAKEAERVLLWEMATKITPTMHDTPGGSGVSDKVGNIAVKLAQLIEETDAAWDRYINQRTKVIKTLELLPANEYGVLHREYIRYMTQEEIAQDMGYSTVQIWRIKKAGLQRLAKMKLNVIESYTIPVV